METDADRETQRLGDREKTGGKKTEREREGRERSREIERWREKKEERDKE